MNSYLVLGNGGGGTSMLRGLMNGHPDCVCEFENWNKKDGYEKNLEAWKQRASEAGCCWGLKIPIEQFITYKWTNYQVASLVEHFLIVWIMRRYSKYQKKKNMQPYYTKHWHAAQDMYWQAREIRPDRIIAVAFEDVLLRPEIELIRICMFLGVDYSDKSIKAMLHGLGDTGHPDYNYSELKTNKV